MRVALLTICATLVAVTVLCGCATTPAQKTVSLRDADRPAWSLHASTDEMIVAVSPARQTLQIAGTAATLLGGAISGVVNARHRRAIQEALDGYDAGAVFEEHIKARLAETLGADFARVAPLGSTAGYNSTRDAQQDRYGSLEKRGHDLLLDLDMTYGLYGFEGALISKLEGDLIDLAKGSRLWGKTVVVSSVPVLASDKLSDPTKRMGPNLSGRLSVKEDAIEQWTRDGGATLKNRHEAAVEGAVSALLTDLGLVDEALGTYYLAKQAMNQKKFEEAEVLYRKALVMDPGAVETRNGLSVNLAHDEKLDAAIALAKGIIADSPDYAPAHYNLAWWYATEREDTAVARPYYERALALGMPSEPKIEKALAGN